jgi:hypothetical protein
VLGLCDGTIIGCLAVSFLGSSTLLTAAERMSDEKLATIFGGCIYEYYECEDGQDCGGATGCAEVGDLCCRGCELRTGYKCSDPEKSTTPPGQVCKDWPYDCPSGCPIKSWCTGGLMCVEGHMNGSEYPDCSDNSYQKCIIVDRP